MQCERGLMLVPSTLASLMLSPLSMLSCLPCTGVLMWAYHVWPAAAAGPSAVGWEGLDNTAVVSNCGPPSRNCSTVLIHSWWQHLIAWMASSVNVLVSDWSYTGCSDHHLWDLDLPTILTRMDDRSEPYTDSTWISIKADISAHSISVKATARTAQEMTSAYTALRHNVTGRSLVYSMHSISLDTYSQPVNDWIERYSMYLRFWLQTLDFSNVVGRYVALRTIRLIPISSIPPVTLQKHIHH